MRYRIKITTYKNGREEYTPQKKSFMGWTGIAFDGDLVSFNCPTNTRDKALKAIDLNYDGNMQKQKIEFEYINK